MGLGQKSGVRLRLVEEEPGRCREMPELSQDAERVRAPLPFGVAEVTGPSMVPTLRHGDRLLVHYGARVGRGDVIVLRHRPASGSSAEVGSSNSISLGSMASARAIATRCCWPPESWEG
ncbi:hypothetical protein SALBM217S_10782 [Streptomyces griseoloalbus]